MACVTKAWEQRLVTNGMCDLIVSCMQHLESAIPAHQVRESEGNPEWSILMALCTCRIT